MINRVIRSCVGFAFIAVLVNGATGQNPVHASTMPASSLPNSASDSACLVKYDSLTNIVCDPRKADVLAALTTLEATNSAASSEASVEKKETEKKTIREVEGVKKEYIYTKRIAYDEPESSKEKKFYTKMRKEPGEDSKRLEKIMNGDKVRVLKEETNKKEKTTWYYIQIFKSHDPQNEGKEGWVETWIVDNENVPAKPTPSPSPTASPKTQSGQVASASTEAAPQPALSSGESEALFSKVNEYRTSNGLPAFERTERLCSIARERAPEIAGEVATGSIHSGFYARGYGYPDVENAVGMGSVDANFNWWVNSGLHRGSILGSDLKYSCLECSNGNCVQIFSANP
jgi:uncharacterized protein YkwD